jgi:preprotein translocase subunit SecF
MRLFKNVNIDFISKRKAAAFLSIILLLIGLVSVVINKGLALSIDFTGGTIVQLRFDELMEISEARSILSENGFENVDITTIGAIEDNEILIKTQLTGANLKEKLDNAFSSKNYETRRVEQVGPKIGNELRTDAVRSIGVALLLILIYIGFRFDFYYAIGSVAALIHDILITLGLFAVFQFEVNLTTVAAFLTIVGYSLNDTIVVFDRIRENIKINARDKLEFIVNKSLNATLSRTVVTSFTTLLVVAVLYLGGLETIKLFALALLFGILIGTFSSIFVASPVMIFFENRAGRKLAKK